MNPAAAVARPEDGKCTASQALCIQTTHCPAPVTCRSGRAELRILEEGCCMVQGLHVPSSTAEQQQQQQCAPGIHVEGLAEVWGARLVPPVVLGGSRRRCRQQQYFSVRRASARFWCRGANRASDRDSLATHSTVQTCRLRGVTCPMCTGSACDLSGAVRLTVSEVHMLNPSGKRTTAFENNTNNKLSQSSCQTRQWGACELTRERVIIWLDSLEPGGYSSCCSCIRLLCCNEGSQQSANDSHGQHRGFRGARSARGTGRG